MATESDLLPSNIGFIGLGAMGYHMAMNLRKRLPPAATLYINDVVPSVVDKFVSEFSDLGPIVVCASAGEVVAKSDCIISIVPEGKHVLEVFTSPNGALSTPTNVRGKVFLECSTIDVATSAQVSSKVTDLRGDFVDAPVSGGPAGALNASLTFMVGYSESHPRGAEIRAILSTMGKNLFACGGPTLGLAAKLANNYISGTIAIATSEGFNLAMRLGLDPRTFHQILKTSTGGSWVNSNCNPVPGVDPHAPASNDYKGGFKVQFMRKDYNLAVEAAKSVDARLCLGEAGLGVYTAAAANPQCVDRDSRVVYRYIGGVEDWEGK